MVGGSHSPRGPRTVPGAWDPLLSCVYPLHRGAGLSESEAEPDGEHNITELPQAIAGRGNMRAQQSAIRLTEVRPGGRSGLPWQPLDPKEGLTLPPCPSRLGLG